ncbi:hypothetical protein EGH10_08775 [Brevibacillus laterosporus]|uniref:Lumazine-binding domain protein n=1 Tax=Brevibacillus laterosporus LMG 15441 TaxID=1042163 RepID=A0A075QWZ4_BRELA|nr:hypothetical protein [Brevibacillus laterosporus]AIG24927.1 hypothetical protein BRLA_c005690 [Brevibacillus laterosporus LMG 15441]RJL11189.1 hypothetical protein DM460_11465 [Brevibacillus laterosporus]TPH13780.1 hypothetical protein EGH10_08775 [Brevibacillus laterosporus]HAS02047.1 hypothetical protein [Brevibacillus sp.]
MKLIPFITLLLSFLLLAACGNQSTMNQNVESTLKNLAVQYIEAEYKGDKELLMKVTGEEAKKDVEEDHLNIFKDQHLDHIVDTKIEKISDTEYSLVVTVSSSPKENEQPTNYTENLTMTKYNEEWLITKVTREQ